MVVITHRTGVFSGDPLKIWLQILFPSLIPRIWAKMNPLLLSNGTNTHCNESETTGLRTGAHGWADWRGAPWGGGELLWFWSWYVWYVWMILLIVDGNGIPHICHFLYTGRIFKFQILHLKITQIYPKKSKICIFLAFNLEKFTPDRIFYTGSARGARDKYEVWIWHSQTCIAAIESCYRKPLFNKSSLDI